MTNTNSPKTILFARVSSREQEDSGYSLPSQEKLLEGYAQNKDLKIVKKFTISESASGQKNRTIFNSMLEYAKKNNIQIIICEKVDRLTRNIKDAVCVNEWINGDPERQVHFVKEGCVLNKDSRSNEKFIWNIKVSVAQFYIDNLSEEVKKGQKEKIAQGHLPTKPPLGYKTEGEKGHKFHVIDEEKAPFIKKMFEMYATRNYSLRKLVEIMYEEGLRNRSGNKMGLSRIADLLSDPFYCGKIRWNGEISDGKQEPLITQEMFNHVQDVLRSKTTPKYNKHFYLFKGLITCAECGGKITWEKQKGILYGHCNHYRSCSQKTWAKEDQVEEQIVKAYGELLIKNGYLSKAIRKALKESHQDKIDYHVNAREELNRRYEQVQARLDRLYDDKLDGKIDKEFYNRKFNQYTKEKNDAIESIKRHSHADNYYLELGMAIYELSQRAHNIYLEGAEDEKRRLIGLIFGDLRLDEGELKPQYTKAFQLLAEAVRATNSSKLANLTELPAEIFEPHETPVKTNKNRAFGPEFEALLRGSDSNRQPPR